MEFTPELALADLLTFRGSQRNSAKTEASVEEDDSLLGVDSQVIDCMAAAVYNCTGRRLSRRILDLDYLTKLQSKEEVSVVHWPDALDKR